jgi:hypothetical protein
MMAIVALFFLFASGIGLSAKAGQRSAEPDHRIAMQSALNFAGDLTRYRPPYPHTLRAPQPGQKFAQEASCPAPQPNEGYCGFYDNQCWYCSAQVGPFFCPGSHTCYTAQSSAEQDCGQGFTICSSPQ